VELARRGDSPRCLVRRRDGTLEEAGPPAFQLGEGDTLVLLTDGVFARLEELRAAPLRDLLAPGTPEAMHQQLIEAAAISGELHDDLTVVLVRREGRAAEAAA
jgi:serine/threonine protein phosphatase PrpC